MDADLERVYELVTGATCAEDVFGDLVDAVGKKSPQQVLQEKMNELLKIADPKVYGLFPDDQETAREVLEKLNKFCERAVLRLSQNLYGAKDDQPRLVKPGNMIFRTDRREYYLGSRIAEGTITSVFDGECVMADEFAGRVVMKIAERVEDNSLLLREMKVLKALHSAGGGQRKHLPVLLDQFKTIDGRIGLVLRHLLTDGYDLYTVRDNPLHQAGVDPKHVVWIMNRLLSAVGYAHSQGIIHGNIEPSHLIMRPRDHNLFVIDWCWSIVKPWETGDRFCIYTEHFSAPEVEDGESAIMPSPASDLYSIGKSMIYLLGGDVRTDKMPDIVEGPLQRFLKSFVIKSQSQRVQDAWIAHNDLLVVAKKLWGKRRFLDFPM